MRVTLELMNMDYVTNHPGHVDYRAIITRRKCKGISVAYVNDDILSSFSLSHGSQLKLIDLRNCACI